MTKDTLRLKGGKIPSHDNPSWEMVDLALRTLHGELYEYVILEEGGDDGEFVQAIGSVDGLLIEWGGVLRDGKRRQYLLVRQGALMSEHPEPYLLDLTDALVIFEEFMKHQTICRHYSKIEITEEIAGGLNLNKVIEVLRRSGKLPSSDDMPTL